MLLDLSCAIYMQDTDESSGSFAAVHGFIVPHMPWIRHLHMHIFGDRVYDFYCLLGAWDVALPAHPTCTRLDMTGFLTTRHKTPATKGTRHPNPEIPLPGHAG